ncbi:MAG TPA: hypothetical protein VF228_02620 [Iamia sp.]
MTTPTGDRPVLDPAALDRELERVAKELGVPTETLLRHVRSRSPRRQISATFEESSIDTLDAVARELGWTKSRVLEQGVQLVASLVASMNEQEGPRPGDAGRAEGPTGSAMFDDLFDEMQGLRVRTAVATAFAANRVDFAPGVSSPRSSG